MWKAIYGSCTAVAVGQFHDHFTIVAIHVAKKKFSSCTLYTPKQDCYKTWNTSPTVTLHKE